MKTYDDLLKIYSPRAILTTIREDIEDKISNFAGKMGISPELYTCFERAEIQIDSFPNHVIEKMKSYVNVYLQTFILNRKNAYKMFVITTGHEKKFFIDKFSISEKTFYNYLSGQNIQAAKRIDNFLMID